MRKVVYFLIFSMFCTFGYESHAQQRPGASGVLEITDWPGSSRDFERNRERYDVAASIDTMSVGYAFREIDGAPVLSMALEWRPDSFGILDGRRVDIDAMPDSVFVTAAAVVADVQVDGRKVAEIALNAEDMRLAVYPAVHHVDAQVLSWERLFAETGADEAQSYFREGFTLTNPRLAAAEFSSFEEETGGADRPRVVVRQPTRRSTVIVDPIPHIFVDLTWIFRGGSRTVVDRDVPNRPREGRVGRDTDDSRAPRNDRGTRSGTQGSRDEADDNGTSVDREERDDRSASSTRTASRPSRDRKKPSIKRDSDDEDDEDDDEKLLPAALTAVAAVGVLAYAGGTIGYYGTQHAPYGASAGMVRPNGGFMLMASVNDAVLGESGPEHLSAKLLGFRQIGSFRIQPAVGAGVLVTHENEQLSYEPSFSLGAVGNFGPIVLFSAYDMTLNGWELGASFNFRSNYRGLGRRER